MVNSMSTRFALEPSYRPQTLGIRQTFEDASAGLRVTGLYATTGASHLILDSVGFQANLSQEDIYHQTLELVREAERIAVERGCNEMFGLVYDFETGVRRALDALSMEALHVLPGWFEGRYGRSFMYKALAPQ